MVKRRGHNLSQLILLVGQPHLLGISKIRGEATTAIIGTTDMATIGMEIGTTITCKAGFQTKLLFSHKHGAIMLEDGAVMFLLIKDGLQILFGIINSNSNGIIMDTQIMQIM